MKIILTLDNAALAILNNCMQQLDGMDIRGVHRQHRSAVALCKDLRTEFLQKAIKTREKDKSFALKLPYYKAEAVWNWLHHFEVYFPDSFGTYENNKILKMKNEIHQQL